MAGSSERRIIVEVVTPEIVSRLEAENAELKKELKTWVDRHNSLHTTVYRLMEKVGDLTRKMGKS